MSQSLLVCCQGIFSSALRLYSSQSTAKLCSVWGQRCFDAANHPESSHWIAGYNYIIRGIWGGVVLQEVSCMETEGLGMEEHEEKKRKGEI